MRTEMVVHKHQQDFEAATHRLQADSGVCPENKAVIIDFARAKMANGRSKMRAVKYAYVLGSVAKRLKKSFDSASKADLMNLFGDLENSHYSENTKYDFKVITKTFYKWFKGNDETLPPEVSWIKPHIKNRAHKLPEQLLTEEDVLKIAAVANNPRDKAIVLVLYETGCRIGELLTLKMKNVSFDQYGAILRISGKTGDRRVRIISSAPALTAWLSVYEATNNPEAPLWPPRSTNYAHKGDAAEYASIFVLLKRLAGKAGVNKRIHPHIFRHSRATFLASKLTEAQMKEYFGWTQGSNMAATYVHLSGRDVDSTLLQLYSLKAKPIEKVVKIDLVTCTRCKERNSPTQSFCGRCGNPFDETKIAINQQSNETMNTLLQDQEVKEFLAHRAEQMGLEKQAA